MVRDGREVGLPAVSLSSIGLPDSEVIALNFDHGLAVPNKSRKAVLAGHGLALASSRAMALAASPAACEMAGIVDLLVDFVMLSPCTCGKLVLYIFSYSYYQ